jgi:hypothetical protein
MFSEAFWIVIVKAKECCSMTVRNTDYLHSVSAWNSGATTKCLPPTLHLFIGQSLLPEPRFFCVNSFCLSSVQFLTFKWSSETTSLKVTTSWPMPEILTNIFSCLHLAFPVVLSHVFSDSNLYAFLVAACMLHVSKWGHTAHEMAICCKPHNLSNCNTCITIQ